MGMGTRKIRQSEAAAMSEPQQAVRTNSSVFQSLSGQLEGFVNESRLQGAGFESAKSLASVYMTITQTFEMLSEQLTDANAKVTSAQAELLDSQIDEEALKNQMLQNQATLNQLSYANSIWNSTNPGQANAASANYNRNLQISIGNENAEIQKTLDSMNDFDMATKYLYDDIEINIDNLAKLIAQVSNVANTYSSSTGYFTVNNTINTLVSSLNDSFSEYKAETGHFLVPNQPNVKKRKGTGVESTDTIKIIRQEYTVEGAYFCSYKVINESTGEKLEDGGGVGESGNVDINSFSPGGENSQQKLADIPGAIPGYVSTFYSLYQDEYNVTNPLVTTTYQIGKEYLESKESQKEAAIKEKKEEAQDQRVQEEQSISRSAGMGASTDGQYYPGEN